MEAGLFYLFETLGEMPEGEFYRQALEEVSLGEEMGFSAVCPAEHHFSEHYGVMPRVELFLAWAAARTRRALLWPMVIVAPLRNPIQLAEDCALLDQFSQGRMVCSLGSGYRKYEFGAFGQAMEESTERLREVAEVAVRLWTEERVTHQGRYYRVQDATLRPRPVQRPHPPVYVTTTRDDQIEWAARHGYGVVPAAGFNPSTLRHDFELARRAAAEARLQVPARRPFFKWIYVGDDHREAVEEGSRYILRTLMAFAQGGGRLFSLLLGKATRAWDGDVGRPEWLTDRVEEVLAAGVTYPQMVKSGWVPYVCGDAVHVTEVLRECAAAGANFFIGGFKCGSMPQERVRRSMQLFAERVLPNL
ncbi:MAG: LLM class flavin-dependent oxidoreductase [Planctomycetes bacterium]|nr:LLM class flavin-dependent oxidoreductase [Planctomycetota bacterium]